MLVLFPDTNVFVQCRPLHEVPWRDLCSDAEVRLVVCRPVQRQLDRLKQEGHGRRAKRARKATALFRELLRLPQETKLLRESTPRVEIALEAPQELSLPDSLDPSYADDVIIGHALAFRNQVDSKVVEVALLTDDTSAALTAKHEHLKCYLVPETWLLPAEPDSRDKQLASLEDRVRQLENDQPSIQISVLQDEEEVNGELSIEVAVYRNLTEDEIKSLTEHAKNRHPCAVPGPPTAGASDSFPTAGFTYEPPDDDRVRQYEELDYPQWLQELEDFLREISHKLGYETRILSGCVHLANDGRMPAKNLDIEFSVTGGMLLLPPEEEDEEPWGPGPVEAPRPPTAPKGKWKRKRGYADSLTMGPTFASNPWAALRDLDLSSLNPIPHDRQAFYCKKQPSTPSSHWALECTEFRHGDDPQPLDFHVLLEPENGGRLRSGGCLKVRVTASNLPVPVEHHQPIRVTYCELDPLDEARRIIDEAIDSAKS